MPLQRVKQVSVTPTPSKAQSPVQTGGARLYSEVVANQKENISPTTSPTGTKGSISPSAPSQRRNGLMTRASNANKRPGFLALDEEDLKARKKKDEAALRRQAKAEQKKSDRARLRANTDRIAAFEDTLSVQHEDNIVNAARPTSRASHGATKAAIHTITPVSEPISDASAKSVIPADRDRARGDVPEHVVVESDASREDDIDYTPSSESEPEAPVTDADGNDENVAPLGPKKGRKKPKRESRAHIEAHRQVKSRTNNMYLASKSGTTNTGKHKHDSDSDIVQPAKRIKFTDANHNLCTTTPAGEDERFNLRFGGIMDEDIRETAPLPVKPSQVKVTTKVEHNAPLIKVEALDPGLPGRRRGKAKDCSTQACLDLNSRQLETWKKVVIPAFRSVLGALSNPWDHSNPELLNELVYICQLVLPDAPCNIEHHSPEYIIACQRGREWRARISREVLQATKVHLIDTCGEAPSAIAEYVSHLMDGARYMWEEHDSHDPNDYKGLFLAPYIIAGITAHLEMTARLPEELQITSPPKGALALATIAAERALKAWESGSCTLGEDVSKKKEEEFSEARWGAATNAVIPSILRLSERKWQKIVDRAKEASGTVHSSPAPALPTMAQHAPDDVRALAYEPDSE
ncbi:hypothetical protein F5887DRAFT_1082120 [Amanita rubescens]|nr:hypothetical protein F5887DRAFT_1082120 [Amanita rubescens]